jgi:RNA polymerase sigma-70 factor (ECF subfamily)
LRKKIDDAFFKRLPVDRQIELIVKHYGEDLYWVIRPIVKTHENADDVLQNTFIKVYKNLTKFRFDSKLFSWLYRIAVNEALSYIKKHQSKQAGDYDETILNLLYSDPYYSGDEISLKLEKAVLQLPPKQQEIFRLKYFNKMKFKEISELTETSEGSLKASYHLAVKKIKKFVLSN